ncbi:putative S-adenosylmethionine-dependent methyltransferase, YraL family [Synechococcus sp. PCC 7502]|uniref:16S rRNA (cytidine(1402)-2'-O)-methyltransferase n=1 Tax=Synechococcus sp. PCC 7502 TaxID=1173263 RepID=UPI00029FB9C0|nr:16S rRNA (cytidine(1402)-2'-O)-methyltransferase [Synechococcus sp. PCC 7502]AFY72889.1 putative S-adenosylmethionine-dependent methyltransferase, YraL family [Synechococcus sp. PCC 7502]
MALGTLYLVGTPIGNLEDMTMRAIKTLQNVDLIAAEDTRHTGKLLHHFQIQTPQISYHSHNSQGRIPELLALLQEGKNIAVVSDAGMPSISDPGLEIVQACIGANIAVIPIPGVSACTTALVASGLGTSSFTFAGFLATDSQLRRSQLEQLGLEPRTMILYEAPHRLIKTLQDLINALGENRQIVIGRELTKLHEEFWRGNLLEAISHYRNHAPRGEFTLVIAGLPISDTKVWTEMQLKSELIAIMADGISRSQASRQLAEVTKLPRRQLYQIALTISSVE